MSFLQNKLDLESNGFSIASNIYTPVEIEKIKFTLENTAAESNSFLKTENLFAIRQLLNSIPNLAPLIFTKKLKHLLQSVGGADHFLTKAIYFDKPAESNWFVAYHQDLSISVNEKASIENYSNWTFKRNQYGVQPPLEILEKTITLRIHLDNTDENNGALKVIPKSHSNGVVNTKPIDEKGEKICCVKKGGVMLMKPLLFHASSRTTNHKQRRVIHLEFCNYELASPLKWIERTEIN